MSDAVVRLNAALEGRYAIERELEAAEKDTMRLYTRIALLALIPMVTSGCSFILVKGPPSGHRQLPSFACTEHKTVPTVHIVPIPNDLRKSTWFNGFSGTSWERYSDGEIANRPHTVHL